MVGCCPMDRDWTNCWEMVFPVFRGIALAFRGMVLVFKEMELLPLRAAVAAMGNPSRAAG